MKVRTLIFAVAVSLCAWQPLSAQQPAAQDPAKATAEKPGAMCEHMNHGDQAMSGCCHGKDTKDTKDAKDAKSTCCSGKDMKEMACCKPGDAKEKASSETAMACCHGKSEKDKDAKSCCGEKDAKSCCGNMCNKAPAEVPAHS